VKRYLFTGSSGIAECAARLASDHGAAVFLLSNAEEQCREVCASLPNAWFAVADVSDAAQVDAGVEQALIAMGGVDAAFHVAGLSGRSLGDGPAHECSEEAWHRMMSVHAGGTFHVTKSLVGRWLERGETGSIVHMSSVLASRPEPTHFATHAYAASKGAVEALTRAAASYYAGQGIRINAIAPSVVRTPMSRRAQTDPLICELLKRKQPLKQDFIEPEEVARLALFLMGDGGAAITGQVFTVDAGWSVSS
jgi:NAD(P)-dependent dehydrogenase (short-subunit alcohol dehydrogenase family)